jgi:murein DD-endopeptidase MepM/ murein hydrolase activator NlpD
MFDDEFRIAQRHAAYDAWLKQRTRKSAEVMAGLHAGFVPLRLDAEHITPDWENLPGDRLYAGGYDEDRAIYDGPVFTPADGEEARTIHLGVDIFAPAGTAVFAPLDGRVHSFQDNANPKDYGPTIILEHTVTAELTFYTLYGHLSRESLVGLHAGQAFAAGEKVATLGAFDVNGSWPPHLHFQVILDMGTALGDFPGVFRKSERARWKRVCPDPAPLLGI